MNLQKIIPMVWVGLSLIILVMGLMWVDDINTWAGTHTNFINLYSTLLSIFIMPAVAWVIKDNLDSNEIQSAKDLIQAEAAREEYVSLSSHDRELFRKNYENVSEALSSITQNGGVQDEAMRLIWKARDQARLELPNDIMVYTESLREIAQKAWSGRKVCWDKDGRPQSFVGKEKIMAEMHEAEGKLYKFEPYEIYRPHMVITETNN